MTENRQSTRIERPIRYPLYSELSKLNIITGEHQSRDAGENVQIGGLQKTTMLDFPGKISAVVFTQGCNFLCPYCHNSDLVLYKGEPLAFTEVIAFLAQRKKVLEGVVISGGEPTLHDGLFSFCATLRSLGYAIKLDTNGSKPDVLRRLLQMKLLDYVAMDIKASPCRYPEEISPGNLGSAIMESIALLNKSTVEYEFRIPCVTPFITAESFQEILVAVRGSVPIFLQQIRQEHVLVPEFFIKKGRILLKEEIERLKKQADDSGVPCSIR